MKAFLVSVGEFVSLKDVSYIDISFNAYFVFLHFYVLFVIYICRTLKAQKMSSFSVGSCLFIMIRW
jgi:hypothetical protein